MILKEKQEHVELIRKTINYLEGKGYENIKADIEGYESPKSFKMTSQDMSITPDIVADTSNGKTQYIEVGMKSESPQLLKSKWKFLKTISEMKNRGFKVVSHRGHYTFADQIMNEIDMAKPSIRL
ncbi:MAG: hypothetical protein ABJG68_08785 [Crocinitomicaceae bacterium]